MDQNAVQSNLEIADLTKKNFNPDQLITKAELYSDIPQDEEARKTVDDPATLEPILLKLSIALQPTTVLIQFENGVKKQIFKGRPLELASKLEEEFLKDSINKNLLLQNPVDIALKDRSDYKKSIEISDIQPAEKTLVENIITTDALEKFGNPKDENPSMTINNIHLKDVTVKDLLDDIVKKIAIIDQITSNNPQIKEISVNALIKNTIGAILFDLHIENDQTPEMDSL